MKVYKNYSLKKFNSFRMGYSAKYFAIVKNQKEVLDLIISPKYKSLKKFVLGGGSNILITKDFSGLVIKNEIGGVKIKSQSDSTVEIEVGAGENWHKFVTWCVDKNYGGIENLALIPGTVGAAPVQNIAAYGQNFSDVFVYLEAVNLKTGKRVKFYKKDCNFNYRTSIFKTKHRDEYIITKVVVNLSKIPSLETSYYQIGINYSSIKAELEEIADKPYTIKDVYKAVVNIRSRKLPDPAKTPTVGSFFLNPIVDMKKLKELQSKISELQFYPVELLSYPGLEDLSLRESKHVKIPAGRLLDYLGWRGKKIGNVWMHKKHALVPVHNGKATGEEIVKYLNLVKKDCQERLGVKLKSEVIIL